LDEEKLDSAIEKLSEEQLDVTSFTSSSLKGTINVSDGDSKFLMLTIPYETGWNVYVDGEKVEYFEAASGLIGIDLPAGEHTIEMKFFPKELTLGIIITVAGLVALAFIWILETKKSKVLLKRLYN
ncbi:MAG: YfhO family protein, partial [Oscillospiraceae bacterium]|nr:YfhO family protein [Oscillospiraceae bacterium]